MQTKEKIISRHILLGSYFAPCSLYEHDHTAAITKVTPRPKLLVDVDETPTAFSLIIPTYNDSNRKSNYSFAKPILTDCSAEESVRSSEQN